MAISGTAGFQAYTIASGLELCHDSFKLSRQEKARCPQYPHIHKTLSRAEDRPLLAIGLGRGGGSCAFF